jgi:ribosomal protein L10
MRLSSKITTTTGVKNFPKKKRLMYNELQELVKRYNVIALSKITKVRATQLMTVRKKFRNNIKILTKIRSLKEHLKK